MIAIIAIILSKNYKNLVFIPYCLIPGMKEKREAGVC